MTAATSPMVSSRSASSDRQPERLRIALLRQHRHPGSTLGQAASPIHDRSSSVFPLPAAADTSVTRAARPSRPNSSRRETIPPLTAGTGLPPVPDHPARSMALAVNPRPLAGMTLNRDHHSSPHSTPLHHGTENPGGEQAPQPVRDKSLAARELSQPVT